MLIINKPSALLEQMKSWAIENNATTLFVKHAESYMKLGIERDINPIIPYVQYALYSNFGHFSHHKTQNIIDKTYCNPCGLRYLIERKHHEKSFSIKKFPSWNEGIIAHLDHLALLAGVDGYPKENSPDPRHFSNLLGSCKSVEELSSIFTYEKDYIKTLIKKIKEVNNFNIIIEEKDFECLGRQIKLLKEDIQDKDIFILKLNRKLEEINQKYNDLREETDDVFFKNDKLKEELLEYKNLIKKISELANK